METLLFLCEKLVTGNEVRLLYFNETCFLSKTVMPLYRLGLLVSESLNPEINLGYVGEHASVSDVTGLVGFLWVSFLVANEQPRCVISCLTGTSQSSVGRTAPAAPPVGAHSACAARSITDTGLQFILQTGDLHAPRGDSL